MARELETRGAAGARRASARGGAAATAARFPDVAVKMVEVGESTGALQEMLNSLADFYDEEIETNLERFVTLVEPVLLVVMGIVIAGAAAGAVHAAVPAVVGAALSGRRGHRWT